MMNEPPNRILEFLTAPARPEGEASRTNRRRRSSAMIELSWAVREGWRTVRGRLRDISRAGAGLVAAGAVPSSGRLRLRLVEGEGTPWIEAEILGVEPQVRKRHRVRLRFVEPCPSFLLRLAILGVVEAADETADAPCEWVAWHPEMGY
jgi:hypothetical protein